MAQVATLSNKVIHAIAVVKWNTDTLPEIAVLYNEGLKVYEYSAPSWSEEANYSFLSDGGCLVAFRQQGLTNGRLAAVIDPPDDDPELRVYDSTEDIEIVPLSVGSQAIFTPYALAAGDFNGDYLSDEIVVAHADSAFDGPVVYTNMCSVSGPTCDTFDPSHTEVLDLGASWTTPTPQAEPVVDDFTSDGDLDLALFQQGDEILRLAENTRKNHTHQLVEIDDRQSVALYDTTKVCKSLHTVFTMPSTTSTWGTYSPTHIVVEEWFEGSVPLMLYPEGAQVFTRAYPGISFQGPVTLDTMLWPTYLMKTGVVHVTIRAVLVLGGQAVAAGPASTCSLAYGDIAVAALVNRLGAQGVATFAIGAQSTNLTEFTGSLPTYAEGPFTNQNATEGSGGGKPPKPPPGLDVQTPPKSPVHP
jgi:hypothetical protein